MRRARWRWPIVATCSSSDAIAWRARASRCSTIPRSNGSISVGNRQCGRLASRQIVGRASWPKHDQDSGGGLKCRARTKSWRVGAGQVTQDADDRGSEGERELIDPDNEADERAEPFPWPLDGKDEAGQGRQIPNAKAEERAARIDRR